MRQHNCKYAEPAVRRVGLGVQLGGDDEVAKGALHGPGTAACDACDACDACCCCCCCCHRPRLPGAPLAITRAGDFGALDGCCCGGSRSERARLSSRRRANAKGSSGDRLHSRRVAACRHIFNQPFCVSSILLWSSSVLRCHPPRCFFCSVGVCWAMSVELSYLPNETGV